MSDRNTEAPHRDFIRTIVAADVASSTYGGRVVTRFPPEPNGFLHIGHSSAICLDFDVAAEHGGRTHLRFDDTNPETEEEDYVEAILADVLWLGYDCGEHLYFASDYFEQLYEYAEELIEKGLAYVDSLDGDTIREYRGTVTEPGRDSPFRDRSPEESLDLFRRMRAGEFGDGEHVLRAKIDMAHPNMVMRDPVLYRIRHASHYRTGDDWCIYPLYDFTHCLSDSIEGITHSFCTLEFDNNREIYDWLLDNLDVPRPQPRQYEFARLNLDYTVFSKRRLIPLVEGGYVDGWDDPRMPTLAGHRRRGYTADAIKAFARGAGVAKVERSLDVGKLEYAIRTDLNRKARRVMVVLDPLKVVVTNHPENEVDELDAPYFPHDVGIEGSRSVPFGRELLIERDDFAEEPPPGFRRLSPGVEVRLRYGYVIRCTDVIKDDDGAVLELRATYDPETRGGATSDGRKVGGTIHWVSAADSFNAPVRLYDRLFTRPDPGNLAEDEELLDILNPESLVVVEGARLERSLRDAAAGEHYQFERQGYFFVDPKDSAPGAPVFNRVVTLRDSWAKKTEVGAAEPAAEARAAPETPRPAPPPVERDFRPTDTDAAARFDGFLARGLSESDANVLALDARLAALFEAAATSDDSMKDVANWVINEVPRVAEGRLVEELAFGGDELAALVELVRNGTISGRSARDVLQVLADGGGDPARIVEERGLGRISDSEALGAMIDALVDANPDKVEAYRGGKTGLSGFFVGQLMKETGGRADPELVQSLVRERLEVGS